MCWFTPINAWPHHIISMIIFFWSIILNRKSRMNFIDRVLNWDTIKTKVPDINLYKAVGSDKFHNNPDVFRFISWSINYIERINNKLLQPSNVIIIKKYFILVYTRMKRNILVWIKLFLSSPTSGKAILILSILSVIDRIEQ